MTQFYIGTKQIEAWPQQGPEGDAGYAVKYKDGYASWSPKDVFERAYLPMGEDNDGTKITQEMVDDFIVSWSSQTIGGKTTVTQAELKNGFTVTESSSCVDPGNYDEAIGESINLGKIGDKVWELLGFVLQCGRSN